MALMGWVTSRDILREFERLVFRADRQHIPHIEGGWTYDIGMKDNLGNQVVGGDEDIDTMLEVVPEDYLHQPFSQNRGRG